MIVEISLLDRASTNRYTEMLNDCNEAMFNHSIQYRNVLEDVLACKSFYFVAHNKDAVLGALPCFLKENSKYGNILNSLPFFGSHGGLLVRSTLGIDQRIEIKNLLLESFYTLAKNNDCVLSTIVTSPLDTDVSFYEQHLQYKYRDRRIAPILEFNSNFDNVEDEILYNIIEPDLRRTIRRPIKHGIIAEKSRDFQPLYEMNKQAMSAKGSISQPSSYLHKIHDSLEEDSYELTYAKKDNTIIAGLLVFFFKNIVNYAISAYYSEYANEQGISLLIYEGMKKALSNGIRYWNFGGTSENQVSLHKFKSRWGTKDYPYWYFVNQYLDISHILNMKKDLLLEEYKWFYVLPFRELKQQ